MMLLEGDMNPRSIPLGCCFQVAALKLDLPKELEILSNVVDHMSAEVCNEEV